MESVLLVGTVVTTKVKADSTKKMDVAVEIPIMVSDISKQNLK